MKDEFKIKVALLQFDTSNSREEDYKKIKKGLTNVKNKGADIALFPEIWTTGYEAFPKDKVKQSVWKEKSIWLGHSEYQRYVDLAIELGIAIVFTFLESNKKRTTFYNAATLIDKKGKTILHYRKTHTVDCGWESVLEPGNKFPVANLKTNKGSVKIGLMICYDREFPEVARLLMLNGSELVLVPNACNLDSNRIAQFQSRGFENMLGVAMSNYPKHNGRSVAFDGMRKKEDKEYDPLLVMAGESEGVFIAEFNIDKLRKYRKKEIWGDAYRKPHLYRPLFVNHPKEPFIRKDAKR